MWYILAIGAIVFSFHQEGTLASQNFRIEGLETRTLFAAMPTSYTGVSFEVGRLVADPTRNLVYVTDKTNSRVLAVDTTLGRTVTSRKLGGVPFGLALSANADRLFVSEPGTFKVEVYSLPNLNLLKTLNLGYAANNIAVGANDKLYYVGGGAPGSSIVEVDAETGTGFRGVGGSYYSPLLHTSADGTKMYVRETGLSGAGGGVDEYDVSGAITAAKTHTYAAPLENSIDFTVDEQHRRLYTADGGVYGVGVTNMDTNAEAVWSYGAPYSAAVATLPSGSLVYGASYYDGVFEFDKATGTKLNNYFSNDTYAIMHEGMKITPNGHLLLGENYWTGTSAGYLYRLSSIGTSSVVVDDVPVARFTDTAGSNGLFSFDASTSEAYKSNETITKYDWNFGDGSTASGVNASHTFAAGTHTVTLTVTSSSGLTDDFVAQVQVGAVGSGGSIAGTVYNDANGNAKRDSGEVGVGNITVYNDANNNSKLDSGEKTTVTDANGAYTLSGLSAGPYKIREILQSGWSQTTPANNYGWTISLASNQNLGGKDFGTRQSIVGTGGSIAGMVWNDLDGDGVKDSNEVGVANITVYNDANNNSKLDSGEKTTITDATGAYKLSNLSAGSYKIREVLQSGWSQTTPANNYGWTISLATNQNLTGKNFGTKQSVVAAGGKISGTIFNDLDGDGVKDSNEIGVGSGWMVYIDLDNDSVHDSNELFTTTDSNGDWTLSGLAAGTYKVRQVLQTGWKQPRRRTTTA